MAEHKTDASSLGVSIFLRTPDAQYLRDTLKHFVESYEGLEAGKEVVMFEFDATDVAAYARMLRKLDTALNPAVLSHSEQVDPDAAKPA